jgi:DNA-binding response OmpR family regulator
MNKKVKILVVEDDEATQYICEFALKNEGYQVVLAPNITEAKAALEETHFNLVLLDLNLPDGKGMSLVELFSSQPFLIMTICATPQERYLGFESGAGDYLVKPFHPGELIHRINKLLANEPNQCLDNILFGDWLLNFAARTLSNMGHEVELTRGEFAILATLAEAKGNIVSRDRLLESVTREVGAGHPRTVDVLISRLRKKVENEPRQPCHILTAPGLGYRLVDICSS